MDSQNPPKLDYPSAPPRPVKPRPKYLASRLISSYIGYLLVMAVLVFFVPRFEPVFRDFKMDVPRSTMLLMRASRLCNQYYLWAALLPVPAVWAIANASIPYPILRRRLRLAAFLIVAAFLIFTLLALFLPMSHLMQTISGPKP